MAKGGLFMAAGSGLPPRWACFDWERGIRLPHISSSSLRGINHPVKSRHFYSAGCESAYNPHNSAAHQRPMYPNVQVNKQKCAQLRVASQRRGSEKTSLHKISGQKFLTNKVQFSFSFNFPCLPGSIVHQHEADSEVVKNDRAYSSDSVDC